MNRNRNLPIVRSVPTGPLPALVPLLLLVLLTACVQQTAPTASLATQAMFVVACGDSAGLIAAIDSANDEGTNPGPDVIDLAAGCIYTLTVADNDGGPGELGRNGLPAVNSTITINGNGATIEREPNPMDVDFFRIFLIRPAGDLTLNDVTVTGGDVSEGIDPASGGGLKNRGTLNLTNSTVEGNKALGGAGIANSGTLTLTNSTVRWNEATFDGGGIFSSSGFATLTDSTVSNNTSENGGGIYNQSASLTLTNSEVRENMASSQGGGIHSLFGGTIGLTNSRVSGNTADSGGGIFIETGPTQPITFDLIDSTVRDNNSSVDGGGLASIGNGISVSLSNSTVSGNSTENGNGGGIYGNRSNITLSNSTVSGNFTENGDGGGIYFLNGFLDLTHSTVSGNMAGSGGGLFLQGGDRGTFVTLTLGNSILANSTGGDCVTSGILALDDLGYNLIEDSANACTLMDGMNNNIVGFDPDLGPLTDNGGPTETHAIDDTSPAFDKIPVLNGSCNDTGVTSDQRGVSRPEGTACDIGAFELVEPPTADPNGPYLAAVDEEITFDGSASSDPDNDPLSYHWDFGDSATGSGVAPMHAYTEVGIYDVCLVVDDGILDSSEVCTIAVVYDPDGGFVTGGGWIDSPAGAYVPDPALTGKANFGFVSKYKKGRNTPDGNTQFKFSAGDLDFHSSSYEWLVVTGSDYARFKGDGTINGLPDENGNPYKFMIWAGDGSPDTFRIRIWSEEGDSEQVVYDNGTNQEIGGGSIVIHSK